MVRKIIIPFLVLMLLAALVLTSSCNRRFWFRKKVNMEKDTAQLMDKDFKIVW